MAISSDESGPFQTLPSERKTTVGLVDLTQEADPAGSAAEWMRRRLEQGFDLGGCPLFEFTILALTGTHHFWFGCYHHIVLDGYGIIPIFRRASKLYDSAVNGTEPAATPFGTLRALLDEENRYRTSETFEEDRAYWRATAARYPQPAPPATPAGPETEGNIVFSRRVSAGLAGQIMRMAHGSGGTLAHAMIVACAFAVGPFTGADDVVLTIPVHGRSGSVARRTPAMCSTALPLLVETGRGLSFADLVSGVDPV